MSTVATLILRHLLTALGGFLAEKGITGEGSNAEEFTSGLVGAGLFIAGVVWSVIQKKKTGQLPPKS